MTQMLQYLQNELAPQPGRFEYSLRIAILTVILVILLETFQTPLPAYSAYILFFISKEEAASTMLTGVIAALAVTISVILTIAIYMISANEPGLRLPLLTMIVFAGMFVSRASPLGPLAFLIGFLVTIALTLIDDIPTHAQKSSADLLTRAVLWLWVVVMLPVGVVIVANIFTGRNPADLFDQGLKERFDLAARFLSRPTDSADDQKKLANYAETGTDELFRYLRMPGIFYKKLQANKNANQELLVNTGRLMVLLNEWAELKVTEPELVEAASKGGTMLSTLAQGIKTKTENFPSFQKLTLPPYKGDTAHERKAMLLLATIFQIIEALPSLWNSRTLSHPASTQHEKRTFHLLAPDAFTNPEYCRYALKTTLAIIIAYITYNMLNWPGIRTVMITCFFVSLGTFGETFQKMTLRIVGALIGGGLGLLSIIYLMPYLTSITGLCLLVGVVAFFAAWVANSSEQLSYAGLQIALAFFLSVLVGYGPTIDLTEPRDRVVGVLLGNIIIFFVFSLIWPTSAVAQARKALANALNKLSHMMAITPEAIRGEQTLKDDLFLAFSNAISQAKRLISFDPFEPQYIQHEKAEVDLALKNALKDICGPVILLGEQSFKMPLSAMSSKEMETYCQSLSSWISQAAEHLTTDQEAMMPLPDIKPLMNSFEQTAVESSAYHWLQACRDWFETLDERMHKLEKLIRTAIHSRKIPLNHAIKESM